MKINTARPRDTRFLVLGKNRAAQNSASWGLYLCTKWDFFFKKQCIFKAFVQNQCFVRLHLCTKGDSYCPFSSRSNFLSVEVWCGILHYSRFEVCLFINRQNMNFGFWNFFLVQIITDYVNFHMTYHIYIWNHAGWHRSVLNMTHFQLFAWFGKTLLVRKMGKNSILFILITYGSKINFQWSGWFWTMCSYQIFKCILVQS